MNVSQKIIIVVATIFTDLDFEDEIYKLHLSLENFREMFFKLKCVYSHKINN
jgi:hypothetical protein